MAKTNPNLLLVEGNDEKYTIPRIMDHYVVWGDKESDRIVEIKNLDSVDEIMKPGVIESYAKIPKLNALGIIIDANDSFDLRWTMVSDRLRTVADDFPEDISEGGVIHQASAGLRLGVWMMPDNRSLGMLETFLGLLLKPDRIPLWNFARESCDKASDYDGTYKDAHKDKSYIYTYLAWSDPPGRSFSTAILQGLIDATSPLANRFADWFIKLYSIDRREASNR